MVTPREVTTSVAEAAALGAGRAAPIPHGRGAAASLDILRDVGRAVQRGDPLAVVTGRDRDGLRRPLGLLPLVAP